MIAWVVGASGAWGRAVAVDLLRRGCDVVALGRHDMPELAAWAATRDLRWRYEPYDLRNGELPDLREIPGVLIVCAAAIEGSREALAQADYLAPARLIEAVLGGMLERGTGRIGVFVGQNARLGLAGLGDFSAAQAALWTWCEALQDELRRLPGDVTITRVIPPRTASQTQRQLAAMSGRRARLRRPRARPLVDAILAGRRTAGRRPIAAALSMLVEATAPTSSGEPVERDGTARRADEPRPRRPRAAERA